MYYTKEQRNKIYKNAYEMIENKREEFVCHAIYRVCDIEISANEKEFPELFLFRDGQEHAFLSNKGFDANTDNFRHPKIVTRKLWVLAFCIAMTE